MNRDRGRREEKARRILQRNNAQEILNALEKLEERRRHFGSRWLWELIQNARDFPDPLRPMRIRVIASRDQIRFAHNGRPFSEEEILSLIYHGSTKQENPEQLGKFGTGFLSSHLLSRKVTVRGVLLEDTGGRRGFEFELDRSGSDASRLSVAMERSYDSFESSISDQGDGSGEGTEFIYDLGHSASNQADQLETQFQIESIPYVLAFDHSIEQIEIDLGEERTIFEREADEHLPDGTTVAVLKQDSERIRLALARDDKLSVAIPLTVQENGKLEVMCARTIPRLFVFLPLVGSSDIGLPAAFNSRQFIGSYNSYLHSSER